MPKKVNTSPRGYLSWSQLSLWEKDQNLYYQVYIEGLDQFKTKYLELGKRMATTLENGFDEEHDPIFEFVATFMPGYPKKEFDIKIEFEGIPLVGKLDGWNEKTMTIGEYKTGKNWTQNMVDKHGQLTFYALLIWLKYKKLPEKILLHWAKTEEDLDGTLKLTGDIKTFSTKRTMKDIIVFSKRIKTAWEGICEVGKFAKSN
jgi:hypothetical protein